MQPRYVTLECGQLQGRLQPGCWLEGADSQQQQQQHSDDERRIVLRIHT